MSRIVELVAELCPDGVEYRNLYDVAHFDRGQVITAKNTVDGGIPVVAGGQKPAYYHNVSNRPAGTITVAGSGAYAGYVSMWDTPIWLSDAFSVAPNDEHELSSAFLYQLLKLNQNWIYAKKKGSGVPHVHGADLSRLQIPVPPIEVQREIVCILDTFTELTDTLTEELNCRRQQYAYYRDRLLSLESLEALDGKPVEMVRLGDVANIKRGTRVVKKHLSASEGYPVFQNSLAPLGYHTDFNEPAGTPFVICAGAAGEIGYSEYEYWAADDCYSVECSERIGGRYAFHALLRSQGALKAQVRKASIPRLSKDVVTRLEIPIPSLATQQKVVDILDRFDALTTSLTDGLPAEIEARKAQYAYYRDRLLDFPHKEVAAS